MSDLAARLRVLVVLLCSVAGPLVAADERPNIVFMLVDNLGYGDIGAYGGGELRGAPTPAIDALAAEGLRLTNFNVEPECIPTRAALLTGRMPIRSALAVPVATGGGNGLSPWEFTLAELLKQAGYSTAMYGKWHLGEVEGRFPTDQGFDEWWGFARSSSDTLRELQPGWSEELAPQQPLLEGKAGQPTKIVGKYDLAMRRQMDATITDKAVQYVRKHAGGAQPFFLYVPFSLPHYPALPNPKFAQPGKSDYQNVLREIDANTGAILAALREAGIEKNTLVVWASDNGPETVQGIGVTYGGQSDPGPFRGEFPSAWEGAIRTPAILRWPGRIAANRSSNDVVSVLDFYATLAHIAGVPERIPQDRAIDSVDQTAFLLGKSPRSARESVMFFYDNELLAIKWRNMKIHFQLREPAAGTVRQTGQGVITGYRATPSYPWIFDLENDPKELWNIGGTSEWLGRPLMRVQGQYFASLARFPNLKPGQVEPEQATQSQPAQPQSAPHQ
jgi:arylsulfatase